MAGDRAVSEATGVAVLIAATVLVTASVGVSVLFFEEEAGVEAQFTYDFSGERNTLLVAHAGGDTPDAGNLTVSGPAGNTSWAALAGGEPTAAVEEGDRVLLSEGSTYGAPVEGTDVIEVVHVQNGTGTVLKTCQAACENGTLG